MDGIALPPHGAGFHHIAGVGVITLVAGCQGPYPGLHFAVVEAELLIQRTHAVVIPAGIYVGVKRADHRAGEVLDHAAGGKFALEKALRHKFRPAIPVVLQGRPGTAGQKQYRQP